ncbi:MAG: peptidoglycan DD-metalloendopeptidase family protein [Acidobacteriota bacterium]
MKQHTIIFVPHARAKFRKWRVSTSQVVAIALGLATLTAGSLVATALYFGSDFDRQQLERMELENSELRAVNQRFEGSIRELEDQLDDYQQRIHKLAIVAGLEQLSPTGEAGIGGVDPLAGVEDPFESLQIRLAELEMGVEQVQGEFDERHLRLSSMPTKSPVKGLLTSGYGHRRDPFTKRRAFHRGIDIVAPHGREVEAPGDAVVIKAGRVAGYGNVVYLSHGFGITTRYGHLSKILVEPGQRVSRGEPIGQVGSTGRSTGTHLHYEVRVDGNAVNPLGYILDDTAG